MRIVLIFSIFCLIGNSDAHRKFPPNFKFGTASASYQVEGGWNLDGKGENIWDRMSHTTDLIFDNSTGDMACDSYHNYKRDVEMLTELGVDYYRFSISWTRILPNGRINSINQAGIDYYNKLIDELISKKIQPYITLYHWDLPQTLQDIGGWANPLIADYFADYAEVAFKAFGDRVKHWLTLNEPMICCSQGYGDKLMAPALNISGIGDYLCGHTMLRAHGKAYRLYEEKFKPTQKGKVGLTLNSIWIDPGTTSTAEESENAMQFELGWFAHPIYSREGDYPKYMKEKIHNKSIAQGYAYSRLPEFTKEEIEYIRGSYDFFGLNHYSTAYTRQMKDERPYPIPSYYDDRDIVLYGDASWPGGASSWLNVVPWGFTKLLGFIRTHYGNPELIVFENGYSDRGGLEDDDRINYLHLYLNALLDAIDQGSNITHYTCWALLDNFEWSRGYTERFGLYSVDYDDPHKTRTPKKSASFYKNIISTKIIQEV